MLSPAASYNTQHQTPPPSFLAPPPPLGILRDISDLIPGAKGTHVSDMPAPPKSLRISANSPSCSPMMDGKHHHIRVLKLQHVLPADTSLAKAKVLSYEVLSATTSSAKGLSCEVHRSFSPFLLSFSSLDLCISCQQLANLFLLPRIGQK